MPAGKSFIQGARQGRWLSFLLSSPVSIVDPDCVRCFRVRSRLTCISMHLRLCFFFQHPKHILSRTKNVLSKNRRCKFRLASNPFTSTPTGKNLSFGSNNSNPALCRTMARGQGEDGLVRNRRLPPNPAGDRTNTRSRSRARILYTEA